MDLTELEQIIKQARIDRRSKLYLICFQITSIPESIGNLSNLSELYLSNNQLTYLPESIGNLHSLTWLGLWENQLKSLPESIGNLSNLRSLFIANNQLTSLPESIGNLSELVTLCFDNNQLTSLPDSIGNLSNLPSLDMSYNKLTKLPDSIGNLSNLTGLYLEGNKLTNLPDSVANLSRLSHLGLGSNQLANIPKSITNLRLTQLNLSSNHLTDLSILNTINTLGWMCFFNVNLPRRYWTKFSDWKTEWLLDEDNAGIRRILIEQVGYEKICEELNAIDIDTWQDYTLLIIDGVEVEYDEEHDELIDTEPMVLLKMTCPSTQHIHILRVPPEMTSAEAAITWVNHGIHPDKFAVQT